jgi:hypothetical protein
MNLMKQTVTLALTGLFTSFSAVAHANGATMITKIESADLSSYIPLVLFAVSAIVVYLCNRPRFAVCARARRRTESSRREIQ